MVRLPAQIEVNAAPLLNSVVAALAEVRLEAVLEVLETTWREKNRKP